MASVDSAADAYRGGLVLTETAESVEAMENRCRDQFNADFGLAIGLGLHEGSGVPNKLPSPSGRGAGGEGGEPETVAIALASSASVQQKTISLGLSPALTRIYMAKQALNFVRLALLGQ